MDVFAYAKLNLALKITGRRSDGYHELDMIMQEISLFDEISVEKSDGLRVTSNIPLPADNTLSVAARLFFTHTKLDGGADIRVQKNIPAQAGLGGGSSDGAAVLKALNQLYGAGLARDELIGLGRKVGADVPFFIMGGCARAQGTGDALTPVSNNLACVYLLAKPAGGVNTKEAYDHYHQLEKQNTDIKNALDSVTAGRLDRYAQSAANDLAPAALSLCPDIQKIMDEMRGAQAALVTGSGSCVFGVYADKKAALVQKERLCNLSFVDFAYVAENR